MSDVIAASLRLTDEHIYGEGSDATSLGESGNLNTPPSAHRGYINVHNKL